MNKQIKKVRRPRIVVFRSNKYLYAQLIDDTKGVTIAAVHPKEIEKGAKGLQAAQALGQLLAQKAKKHKVTVVVFDRNGYKYHGNVKALAEGARAGGLQF